MRGKITILSLALMLSFTHRVNAEFISKDIRNKNIKINMINLKDFNRLDPISNEIIQPIKYKIEEPIEEEPIEVSIPEETIKKIDFAYCNIYNLKEVSDISEEKLYEILEGTALQELSSHYIKYEEIYGVNAIFVVALTAEESGWGTSYRAVNHNNLSGFNINSDDSYYAFSSKQESLEATYRLLSEEYLNEAGNYYNGLSIYNVNERYCNDSGTYSWSNNISTIINELKER